MTPVYLTDGRVAWQIPPGDIEYRYENQYYLPYGKWTVSVGLPDLEAGTWYQDEFGCWRKRKARTKSKVR